MNDLNNNFNGDLNNFDNQQPIKDENINNSVENANNEGNNSSPPNYHNDNGNANKNKSRKYILIIIIVAIITLIIGIIISFITNHNHTLPKDNIENNEVLEDEKDTITQILDRDYLSGIINADEYILQLAYSIYEPDKIDDKYKSFALDFNEPHYLFEKFEKMVSDLNDKTISYIFEKYTLSDVKWDVQENLETDKATNTGTLEYKVKPLVNDESNVSKLDNVKLSSEGHFLIYYTKNGTNAITDKDATNISMVLESVVSSYKSKYDLDFNYSAQYEFWSASSFTECPTFGAKGKACKLLKSNNIDTKYLDTAIPVFIIDTDAVNTNKLGYYVPPIGNLAEIVLKVSDIFSDMGAVADNMMTTYSFPFFVVSSSLNNFDDTKIVLAHELFHHYQKYICGDGKYKDCSSGNFTVETTANVAASQGSGVNKKGTVLNGHAGMYIKNLETSMDQMGFKTAGDSGLGYGAFVFANNYANIVNNGSKYLFDSMKTPDTLKYLYDNSGGKYKEVLLTTAEKNLTKDYSNKLLIADNIYPKRHTTITEKTTQQSNTINYSSMHYYFINPKIFSDTSSIEFKGSSNNLTLLIFKKEGNSYKYLERHDLNTSYSINLNKYKDYDEVAIAIVNSEISGTLVYSYKIGKSSEKEPEDNKDNSSSDCYNYEITNGEVTIIKKALARCPETLTIPDKIEGLPVTKIDDEAFLMLRLKSVTLGKNIKYVGKMAFDSTGLSNITLNDNLQAIGENAFSYNDIQKIIIPNSVTSIKKSAFQANPINEITLGSGLETVEEAVFSGVSTSIKDEPNLEKLIIPDNVKAIKTEAFRSLKIKELVLGQNLETIGMSAFSSNKIENLIIPDKVKAIESLAFALNPLETITIGKSVTTIGYHAFSEDLFAARIKTIVNNSGQGFAWNSVIGTLPVSSACGNKSCKFETGELKHPLNDYVISIIKSS